MEILHIEIPGQKDGRLHLVCRPAYGHSPRVVKFMSTDLGAAKNYLRSQQAIENYREVIRAPIWVPEQGQSGSSVQEVS